MGITQKIKQFKNSEYLKNFTALAGSEGVAQGIQIGVSPILARIYTPTEFGQYELFKSIASLLVAVGFLQYDVSIYTAKSEDESINAWALSVIILFSICLFAALGIFLFNDFFLMFIGAEIREGWLWTLPVYVFFSSLTNLFLVCLTKSGSFILQSKIKILVSVLVASTQIMFGYLDLGYWGLIYSTLLVQFIAFLFYFYPFLKEQFQNMKKISIGSVHSLFRENWRLPVLVLPGNFLNNFVHNLPVFFLGSIDNNVLGYFSLARRIIDFPLRFITTAVQRLYVNELTDEINTTGLGTKSFSKNLKLYSAIALILFLGILTLTKPVLPILFGKEWTPAIPYIIVLGLLFSVRFIFGGLGFIMILGKAPNIDILWQISFSTGIIFTFATSLYLNLNPYDIIIAYVLVSIFFYMIYGVICYKISNSHYHLTNM